MSKWRARMHTLSLALFGVFPSTSEWFYLKNAPCLWVYFSCSRGSTEYYWHVAKGFGSIYRMPSSVVCRLSAVVFLSKYWMGRGLGIFIVSSHFLLFHSKDKFMETLEQGRGGLGWDGVKHGDVRGERLESSGGGGCVMTYFCDDCSVKLLCVSSSSSSPTLKKTCCQRAAHVWPTRKTKVCMY